MVEEIVAWMLILALLALGVNTFVEVLRWLG